MKPRGKAGGVTCEDVGEGVTASDLQRRVLGAEDVQEES